MGRMRSRSNGFPGPKATGPEPVDIRTPQLSDERKQDYDIERLRSANHPALMAVDRDAFLRELEMGNPVSAELLQAVVQAFLVAALHSPTARAPEGWHLVMERFLNVLGTAMRMGLEDVRPAIPVPPPPSVPRVPPIPPWAIAVYERRRPTLREIEADLAYWQGLPVRLVEALLRGHLAARLRSPDGTTPEGRSRINAAVREILWDAVLDAVKRVPCPAPTPSSRPAPTPRPEKRQHHLP